MTGGISQRGYPRTPCDTAALGKESGGRHVCGVKTLTDHMHETIQESTGMYGHY